MGYGIALTVLLIFSNGAVESHPSVTRWKGVYALQHCQREAHRMEDALRDQIAPSIRIMAVCGPDLET